MPARRSFRHRVPSRNAARLGLIGALGATVLLSSGTATAAPSGIAASNQAAAFAGFPDFAALADSLTLKAPVLLHGRLAEVSGKPMSGAQVLVSAWPSRETVRALPKGATFATTPVARTVAGRDGSFEFRSELTPALDGLIGAEGLDLEVQVIHARRQYDYLTDVDPVREVGAWVRSLTDSGALPAAGAGVRNLLDITLDPATAPRLPAGLARGAKIPAAVSSKDDPFANEPMFPGRWCTRYKKIDTKKTLETVATAIARDGVSAQVLYSVGAVTESSAGVSLNGIAFGAAGTRTHTSTISAKFPSLPSRESGAAQGQYAAQVAHNVVEQRCLVDNHGTYRSKYKTAPDRTIGAKRMPITEPSWKCNGKNKAYGTGTMTADTQRAHTYQRAFSFSPLPQAIFTGSATSGYSKSVVVEFDFERSGDGEWCGHNGFPSDAGQMLQGYVP